MHNIRKNKGVHVFCLIISMVKIQYIKSFIYTLLFETISYLKHDIMDKLTDNSYRNYTLPKLKCFK